MDQAEPTALSDQLGTLLQEQICRLVVGKFTPFQLGKVVDVFPGTVNSDSNGGLPMMTSINRSGRVPLLAVSDYGRIGKKSPARRLEPSIWSNCNSFQITSGLSVSQITSTKLKAASSMAPG